MARLVVCVLALLVASGLTEKITPKPADAVFLQKQVELMDLFYHIREPLHYEEHVKIAESWSLEKNLDKFNNVTAVKMYVNMMEIGLLPRGVPFAVLEHTSQYEAQTLFNVFYSAKDYETFYKTAVYLRNIINEELFAYVLSVAIIHRPDTQGIVIPPIYEIFPSYFNNGAIMTEAKRLNVQGELNLDKIKTSFKWNDNLVVRWNNTIWGAWSKEMPLSYFTHDHVLNALYYNYHVTYPKWLGGDVCPLVKDRRGEWFWYIHKQLVARYYMERLSNGLGEIPVLGAEKIEPGYESFLVYSNGMPFPSRPDNFRIDQDVLFADYSTLWAWENRVFEAIDRGYFVNSVGEHESLRNPEDIEVLGRLIDANVDSPNSRYYKDFISLWKKYLGNTLTQNKFYYNQDLPLTLPSVLEHYQTALRDPAFYILWKHFLSIFTYWQQQLPLYKREELVLPTVAIEKVETDKLLTYFEQTYINVTNELPMTEYETKVGMDSFGVLVQRPVLTHKVFKVRVHVKSDVAKTVVVKFFLAPKYDSKGMEIPLHLNTENFLQLDQFTYDLPVGETIIKRDSSEFYNTISGWDKATEVYQKAQQALKGKGQFMLDQSQSFDSFPNRLVLPKGRVGGMPYVLMVYISEYHAPKVAFGTGFDPAISLGIGSGARQFIDEPLGFPVNRPLYKWQVQDAKNMWFQDVLIYHKHTAEIEVPHAE